MSKFEYTEKEQQINNVLNYQSRELEKIKIPDMREMEVLIQESEFLLKSLGHSLPDFPIVNQLNKQKILNLPTWKDLCIEAENNVGKDTALEDLFSIEELQSNEQVISQLNQEFNAIHKLDKIDITISAGAGILGAIVDILLVGIPEKSPEGLKAGPLSNHIRDWFDKKFPKEEMEKLANSKVSKVPYDAQDNRNTTEYVNGLSAYYHRLLSLGHDPILGLIFGVFDIMSGRMTTIDKTGKIVSQTMERYSDRKESDIFVAIAKQILHFKSDINTSMGLPVPLMGLLSLLQFGSVGEEEQTIAEIVQGMYYEGYDFVHFCSMSIPTMIIEVVVRLGYTLKKLKEGSPIRECIPFSLNREKTPKLCTMLFIGHSGATAINAGKIYFTKNPMAINYAQWISFAKYSYKQLKWVINEKSKMRENYVMDELYSELKDVYNQIDSTLEEYIIIV